MRSSPSPRPQKKRTAEQAGVSYKHSSLPVSKKVKQESGLIEIPSQPKPLPNVTDEELRVLSMNNWHAQLTIDEKTKDFDHAIDLLRTLGTETGII